MSDIDVTVSNSVFTTVKRLFGLGKEIDKASIQALNVVGLTYATWIKQNIQASGATVGHSFAPNAPQTIKQKGSSKPLIDDADLKNSIRHKQEGKSVFIGLLRTASHPGYSGGVANLGQIHEYGSRDGHIPARPFIEPVASSRGYQNLAKVLYRNQVRRYLVQRGWNV